MPGHFGVHNFYTFLFSRLIITAFMMLIEHCHKIIIVASNGD